MRSLLFFILALSLTAFVCKQGDKNAQGTDSTPVSRDTTIGKFSTPPARTPQPNAIRPNITRFKGVVTHIALTDSIRYRLGVHIDSTFEIGDMASLVEPGQDITLAPRYVQGADNQIDTTNERNKRLLALRSCSKGAVIGGKISLQAAGAWVLVDADSL